MAGFNRRTMMHGAVAAGAFLQVPSLAAAVAPHPSVIVVDRRFLPSAAFAQHWRTRGVTVIDARLDDLGIAWRRRIPDLLKLSGANIAGVTLWSDLLICQMCARGHGLVLASPPRPVAPAAAPDLHHWTLRAPD